MNVMSYAKRLTALLLCAVLLLGLMPVGAFAAETEGETTAPAGETTVPTGETTAPVGETEGDNSVMPLADPVPGTATVPGSTTTYAENVYVKVDSLTAGGQYLIVNVASGNGVALTNNNGTIDKVNVTVLNGDDGAFIVLDDATAVWSAASGIVLSNNGSDLGISTSNNSASLSLSGSYKNWTYSSNTLYQDDISDCGTQYLNYSSSNGWTVSGSQQAIYVYQYLEGGTTATVPDVTYGINVTADEIVVSELTTETAMPGSTLQLGSAFTSTLEGQAPAAGGTYTWSVTTGNGVASVDNNGLVTFTGVEGTETVQVSYTWTVGETAYTVYNTVVITAKAPVFALSVTEESATLKPGAEQTMTVVRLMNGEATTMGDNAVVWSTSDEAIATVDQNGKVTAVAEGTATITASWEDPLGNTRTDTVAVSVVDAIYTLEINEGSAHVETAVAAGKTLQLTATLTIDGETVENPSLNWTVDNAPVATVDSATGLVTFTGAEGRVIVTVTYTAGAKEITDTFVITARKASHVLPGDGTNDFPEYPNEGAVRIDKNASAVGNFSETGIALVELSMTGVPYSAGNEIDVVIMIDMSTSMTRESNGVADRVTPARTSAVNALEAIVKNEDGSINNNRVAVYTFNGYNRNNPQSYADAVDEILSLKSYQNADNKNDTTNLTNAQNSITNWIQEDNTDSGTNYGAALEKCYTVLRAAKEQYPDRKQFVIFVTDGEPTTGFAYETEDGGVADDGYNSNYSDGAADKYYTYTEYYSKQMRAAGVEVYTVGIQLTNNNANTILKKIAGNVTGTAYANSATHADYAQFIDADESAAKLVTIFEDIVNAIKEAATNVTVTDKITNEYTMVLEAPNADVAAALPEGTELTIDVKQYTLDENKNRTGDPVIIESVALTDTDKVTLDENGNIVSIDADNFYYDAATHIITWKADKLDSSELALSYYLYLDQSAGYDPEEQTAPGPYPTNEYAYIDYTNHLDHQCRKEFPIPQLTWNGAQVSYTFYLVNAQGQPVNRAGRVIPFAEAIYVTDVVTQSITWDTNEGDLFNANLIAQEYLPDVYSLYDPNTTYTINVYEDENGVDQNNFFKIEADRTFKDENGNVTGSTTKVFNTKSGTIYSAPGTYTAENASGFDFATTTVAFAVVWNPALAEDTMVVDFGLDVVIDVATNDSLDTEVVGLRTEQPNATINTGLITPTNTKSIDIKIDGVKVATAEVENQTSIRFVLDKENGMLFNKAVTFYYESKVEYYQNDELKTSYMYSAVTVIPATTIYYEDSYVTLKTFTKNEDGSYAEAAGWPVVGTAEDAAQAQDRPGKSQISAAIDADNNYGYDAAYAEMSEYSMGSAVAANVTSGKYATAEFEFYGTGFDVISLTDKTTGTIVVEVLDANSERVLKESVNTYFGYKLVDGNWVATESGDVNALYQVPVIKIGDGKTTEKLAYGKYKVVITATYVPLLDADKTDDGYNFYLDAIRVYNPTGNQDDTSNDAYIEDGEAYPEYFELRDKIIEKGTFDALTTDALEGVVFIDGNTAEKNVADYTSFGPNNEVYLAKGQAVSFELNATGPVAKVQIALKSAGGSASVKIYSADGVTALDANLETATDMYYDITSMNGKTVVIVNDGEDGEDGVLSITNVKVTYTADPNGAATTMFMVRRASVNAALDTMNVAEPVVPETTVPETTEPEIEETEPETTEPETEETEPEETEPSVEDKVEEIIKKTVRKVVKKIFGWLFG